MKALENKIPPPLVAIAFGYFMWTVSDGLTHFSDASSIKVMATLAISVAGAYFSIAGVIAFRTAKTTVNPLKPESASSLVKSGIYQVSRNPMYVGFTLFLASWAVYLGSLWSMLGVIGFVLCINRFQIIPEERAMHALFGKEFEDYSKQVRRWL